MRFLALATDYDGTIARDGAVSMRTVEALGRLRASGRKVILVTGRELPDLGTVFPELERFDLVIAENGALLYFPMERREQLLADGIPVGFVAALRKRGVTSLNVGRSIVSSLVTESAMMVDVIREMGLDLQVIFNKESVMVLPVGVNKATGLAVALECVGVAAERVVGVGDAENDEPMLAFCGLGAAVANGLPSLKVRADMLLRGRDGDGVVELIDWMVSEGEVPEKSIMAADQRIRKQALATDEH